MYIYVILQKIGSNKIPDIRINNYFFSGRPDNAQQFKLLKRENYQRHF